MIITFITAAIALSFWFYVANYKYRIYMDKIHKIHMQEERNKQVHAFRMRLLMELNPYVNECMGSYDEMLESKKPLIASEWVNVDKLTRIHEVGSELDFNPYAPVDIVFINPN